MIINLYQKLATKQTQFRKYQTHGNVRIVPFTGVLSSIPCELIPAKNNTMLKRRKEPFIVASVFHHNKDCACVSLIKFFNCSRLNNVEHISKNI